MRSLYTNHLHKFSAVDESLIRRAFTNPYTNKINQKNLAVLSFRRFPPGFSSYSCSASAVSVMTEEEKQVFDTNEAVSLVKELRKNFGAGKTKSYEWRISQLEAIQKMTEEKEKEISEALYKDLGKPELEGFIAEINLVRSAAKEAIKELKHWMKPEKAKTSVSTYPSSAEIVSEPLGVALVISTWNFPFLLSVDPVIGAIAAGNAVVLKPSEIAPATSSLLAELVDKYLDKSTVRVIEGAVPETTALLEQRWDKILYTGSAKVARIVMAAAAKHLTPVTLELGGKCPAVVDSNIDIKVAIRRIIAGKWACNNGQACIGIDYIITTKAFAPQLIDAIKKGVEECFGENPMDSADRSRIVNEFHFTRLERLMDEDGVSSKIVYGGHRDKTKLQIAPTLFLDVPEDSAIMQEEIFGPLLPIVTVDDVRDSFEVINSKPKPLAAYLFTNDENLKKDYVQNVSSGGMLVNDAVIHVSVPTLPFGGVGESGMGAYHGKYSFDAFSHKKSVLYRKFEGDAEMRYPPFTPRKQKLMKAVINGGIFGLILALLGFSK